MNSKIFWELFRQSVIITGSLAVIVVLGAVIMAVQEIALPDWYSVLLTLVVGFFFGSKAGVNSQNGKG